MYKLYDTVKSKKNLSDSVNKGTIGTVLMIYDEFTYEVEFVNDNGETIGTFTVEEKDLVRFGNASN